MALNYARARYFGAWYFRARYLSGQPDTVSTHGGVRRRRRYILPNGLHVWATQQQVEDILRAFGQPAPVRKYSAPQVQDVYTAATQVAPVRSIRYEDVKAGWLRRRQRLALMLLMAEAE